MGLIQYTSSRHMGLSRPIFKAQTAYGWLLQNQTKIKAEFRLFVYCILVYCILVYFFYLIWNIFSLFSVYQVQWSNTPPGPGARQPWTQSRFKFFFVKFGCTGRVSNTPSLPYNLIFRKFILQEDTEVLNALESELVVTESRINVYTG